MNAYVFSKVKVIGLARRKQILCQDSLRAIGISILAGWPWGIKLTLPGPTILGEPSDRRS
jgi:hypothetical protein